MAYNPQRHLERLERIRKAGLLRFVLVWGLVWGVPFAVAMHFAVPSPAPFYFKLLVSCVGGIIWAVCMWGSTMWQYKRVRAKIKTQSADHLPDA